MGLISWVYKKFLQFTKKKKITNRYKIWTDISCKTSQCQGKMSNIISHQRNANKTTVRYHFMPKRMARKHTYIHTYTHTYTDIHIHVKTVRWAGEPVYPLALSSTCLLALQVEHLWAETTVFPPPSDGMERLKRVPKDFWRYVMLVVAGDWRL